MCEKGWWENFAESEGDGLMLDMFCPRFRATQVPSKEKIYTGGVHSRTFCNLRRSPLARKYNFKVHCRHCDEEKCLVHYCKKYLDKEEACLISINLHIKEIASSKD